MSKITNDGLTQSGWHRMLYSCTHMATVGVKGLKVTETILSANSATRRHYIATARQRCFGILSL